MKDKAIALAEWRLLYLYIKEKQIFIYFLLYNNATNFIYSHRAPNGYKFAQMDTKKVNNILKVKKENKSQQIYMEGKIIMKRRICRLADKGNRTNVDLRDYEEIIIDTINEVVPNKNPIVTKNHFITDQLTQGQSVRLGLALSAIPDLAVLGKTITTFRLFDGKIVEDTPQATSKVMTKDKQKTDDQKEKEVYGRHHRKKIPHDRRSTESVLTD